MNLAAAAVRGVLNESLRSARGLRSGVIQRRPQWLAVASGARGVRNEFEELGGGREVQRDWSYGLPQNMW